MKTSSGPGLAMAAWLALPGVAAFAADNPSPNQAAAAGTPGPGVSAQPVTPVPPVPRPSVIYLTDFHLDPAQVEEKSLLGGERSSPLGGQREGPLHGRLPRAQNKSPEKQAPKLVRVLSDSIVKQLKKEGLQAEYLPDLHAQYLPDQTAGRIRFASDSAPLPKQGWLVTGWFEKLEEGSAAVEATVGMGKGSGQATADVVVSDLARDPAQPFLIVGSGSRAKKMPGGLVTMNPYVMAAKFVVNKRQGTEKEVKSLGIEIAESLVRYIHQGPAQPQ
jgi:hypothetical protein